MNSYVDDDPNRVWRDGRWQDAKGAFQSHGGSELIPLDLVALDAQDPRPAEFVVERLFPRGEGGLLVGPPGFGKTYFMLIVAVAMAAGLRTVLGLSIAPGPVVFYTAEDSERELHWRLVNICRKLNVRLASLAGRLHIIHWRGQPEGHFGTFEADGKFQPSQAFEKLKAFAVRVGAAMVVVDNLAHVYLGNENDRAQITRAMGPVNGFAEDADLAFVMMAHPPKSGDSYSGSTAWQAVFRSHAHLGRDPDGDPDVRVLTVEKANYAAAGELARFRWYDHTFVCDTDLPGDTRAEIAAVSRTNAANDKFLTCLDKLTEQGRNVTHSKAGNYAPRLFAKMPMAKGFSEGEFEAAMERLFAMGAIVADAKVGTYSNRSAKLGLARSEDWANGGAQNPAQSDAHNLAQDRTKLSVKDAQSRAHNTPYPTGMDGGDHSPPPPSPRGEDAGAGEFDPDEPIPGWDDD